MDINKIIDYTNLKIDATFDDIKALIDEAVTKGCASVCIQPKFVKDAFKYSDGRIPICTVIGFPNGYNTTSTKIFEAKEAIDNGASEIDMVININDVKMGNFESVFDEVRALGVIAHNGGAILKVIIETCALTDDEIIKMCEIVATSGADFIKTSTGFGGKGAEEKTVALIKTEMDKWNNDEELKARFPNRDKIKIKASGGIRSKDAALIFAELGADRLGCSKSF